MPWLLKYWAVRDKQSYKMAERPKGYGMTAELQEKVRNSTSRAVDI